MNKQLLWQPNSEQIASANMTEFMDKAAEQSGQPLTDYHSLWQWSVDNSPEFWSLLWDYCEIVGDKGLTVLQHSGKMPGAKWFPEARLNYAENLLRETGQGHALVFWGEDKVKRRLNHDELQASVSRCQQALIAAGIREGDCVAGYLPNLPETIAIMLAVTSLGAVWSSASPDFGVEGVVDRFGQIKPKALFCVDGYYYNGKYIDCMDKNQAVVDKLDGLDLTIVVPYDEQNSGAKEVAWATHWDNFLQPYPPRAIEFNRVPFDHPSFILFSSGTTGVPKCIVHSVGGTLMQHLKEHRLHANIKPADRFFYFTTCGWMMWNWLVSGLASRATLLLYDGSPFAGDKQVLFDYAEAEQMTQFGTSAKFIEACHKFNLQPKSSHDLAALRSVFSTGSPLTPEGFRYIYQQVKQDVHLASITGGTDIISCFALGAPTLPVYCGELQCRGLGMAVDVFDENGHSITQQKGDLVCIRPFPSMPIGFWGDEDGSRYHAAYFDQFSGVWCHGDYVELTEHNGMIVHGRSDATLNPGGVRIGTAEIYRQVEKIAEVMESIVIGQEWQDDVRVVLFVKLGESVELDDELINKIKKQIRNKTTPRHVPEKIIQIVDIPRTKSGKIVELAVRDVVHGRVVKNVGSLANPEALEYFRDRPELA